MTYSELRELVDRISFKDWRFLLHVKGDGFLLQLAFDAPDSVSGKVEEQRCRKWYISSHACRAEVIRTAWKAVEAAVNHEAAELFKYKGATIFSPHIDPDALLTPAEILNNRK